MQIEIGGKWVMNINEIYLGDAYELIKQVPDKSVDLIVTDPPYEIKGVHNGTGILKNKDRKYIDELMLNDNQIVKGVELKILGEFVRVMKKINCYIWCNKEQIYDYLTFFAKERGCNWEMIVWAKENPMPFYGSHYLKDKEYCLYFWEKGVKLDTRNYEAAKTVYISRTNKADKNEYDHPTIKPEAIIENLILNSSGGGQLILDPFCGSGTTCAVAKRLGRNYIGFEIEPKWHKVACDRLNGVTAREAKKGMVQIDLFE